LGDIASVSANPPSARRAIPSVEKLLQALGPLEGLPRPLAVAAVRRELAALRATPAVENGVDSESGGFEAILARVRAGMDTLRRSRIQLVINAAGVIVHTNLGRAPLAASAVETISALAANYNNLEYALDAGERGPRAGYLEHALALLCRAEAATAVNNCAAALVLMLRHFTRGRKKEVIISRGELVQIGGGFRIPEILEASGATLREVGTTNKTTTEDYAANIGPGCALILKVHQSNFYQGGFTALPAPGSLAELARRRRIPFAEDLGSGAIYPTDRQAAGGCGGSGCGVERERTPLDALRDGADLVCFSGDKLFGGSQAGLIVGKGKLVAALKREPFYRALRCDKLILGALQATVDLHLAGREADVPVVAMMRLSLETLRGRAEAMVEALAGLAPELIVRVGEGRTQIGGGALPRSSIASVTLEVTHRELPPAELAARLRAGTPPVIAYVHGGVLKLDLRTVFAHQDADVLHALRAAAS
jgi:L-seryl-tRNA(Ser) seleniumtransferase